MEILYPIDIFYEKLHNIVVFSLIILIVLGSGIAYLSLQNIAPVTISFLHYSFIVPLYYVIIGSMLVGILLAYIIYLIHYISSSLEIRKKNKELNKSQEEMMELVKKNHQLELENAKSKTEIDTESFEEKSL